MPLSLSSIAIGVLNQFLNFPTFNFIGGIQVDTTLEEIYEDTLEVTEHPVEAGAQITDHSFKRPMELLLRCGWSDSNLLTPAAGGTGTFPGGAVSASDYVAQVYSQLLQLQQSRALFSVTSGLRTYDNMLLLELRVRRNQRTQYALLVEAFLREVIIVSTQATTLAPQANQSNPQSTADIQNTGTQQLQSATPSVKGAYPPQ